MKQKGTNREIRKHLLRLSPCRPSPWYIHQCKDAIMMRPAKMHTVTDIVNWIAGAQSEQRALKVRAALYELCADDQIAFVSKHFHVWEDSIIKRKNAKMVFYSKQKDYRAEILKEWECEQKPQRADISDQVAYLDDLIEKLKQEIVRIETKKNELLGPLFERHRDQFLKLAKEQDNAK
jgi:hypothetical protein